MPPVSRHRLRPAGRFRLWAKVMVVLLPIVVLVFGLMISTNIHAQGKTLTEQTEHNANLTATAIKGGMFDALAIDNNDDVRKQFMRLNEKVSGLGVPIFDFKGDIAFATQTERSGKNIAAFTQNSNALEAVQAMLKGAKKPQHAFIETIAGKPI